MTHAIDEYKALRDEVKPCESEALSTSLYVTTAVIVASSLADKASLPQIVVPILVQVVLIWGMRRFYNLTALQGQLSSYIQLVIEPKLPGLQWETLNHAYNSIDPKAPVWNKSLRRKAFRMGTNLFFLLMLVGFGVSTWALLSQPRSIETVALLALPLAPLHVLSTMLAWLIVFGTPSHEEQLARWRVVLSKRAAESPEDG